MRAHEKQLLERLKKLQKRVERTDFLLKFLPMLIVDWFTWVPHSRLCATLHPSSAEGASLMWDLYKRYGEGYTYTFPIKGDTGVLHGWEHLWCPKSRQGPLRRRLLEQMITHIETLP